MNPKNYLMLLLASISSSMLCAEVVSVNTFLANKKRSGKIAIEIPSTKPSAVKTNQDNQRSAAAPKAQASKQSALKSSIVAILKKNR